MSRIYSAGNEIIPGAFRRRLDQIRSLYLDESFPVEKIARADGYLMTHSEISLHFRLSQIEIAIFEPEIYLDDIIKDNYKIKRILCNHRYNTSSPEQVIYYDTTKGMYVFLHIPDNNEPDVSYLIPWDVVEEKAEEAMDFYEENDDLYGYTPFYDAEKYFSDYKLI